MMNLEEPVIGRKLWVIPEGYLPAPGPHADDARLRSHETACILNAGPRTARICITIYFSDRDPAGPFLLEVPAKRTRHLRFDELEGPETLPRERDYASVIESNEPVVVQFTRLDARLGSLALMSTLAYTQDSG